MPSQAVARLAPELRAPLELSWEHYCEAAAAAERVSPANPDLLAVLCKVWACSEFVAKSCIHVPEMWIDLVRSGDLMIEYAATDHEQRLRALTAAVTDEAELGKILRQLRCREMVRIAWRDIAGWSDLERTLADLSNLARACVAMTLELLQQWQNQEFGVPHGAMSGKPQSLVVLGMGKLGAGELNFSSDIDLIFAYPEEGETRGKRVALSNEEYFIKLGRRLITLLNQQTAEGYVFRVDMRLRPFGDAGSLAMSFDGLEDYYQTHGREWERYALIKAGVIAGDERSGQELLKRLRPFIYRRYLDFNAFESLREMKAMINVQVQRKGMEDNIKLGPGGIREVEFTGQAFQLIRGGREPELQIRPIRQVLAYLGSRNYLPQYVTKALDRAYVFLRQAENRLQAMADQQTHELPEGDVERLRLATAMGFDDWPGFERELRRQMALVHEYFQQVFAAPQQEKGAEQGSVFDAVWSGSLQAEAAVAALAEQGFDDAAEALRLLEQLRESFSVRALTPSGRERMNRLLPLLLGAIAAVENSTETLARVLALLETIARRTTYLALLAENPMAMSQLVKLCAASPWITVHLSQHPILLDELLDPRSLYAPLNKSALEAELALALERVGDDQEQQLEALRHFKQANVLRVAAADVAGVYPLMIVSDHLTEIAEVLLAQVLRLATQHLEQRHGRPDDTAGFVIVGYGKLGGIELGYGSDLDLVFLHSAAAEGQTQGGRAPLDNPVFFARLGQRIIHMMTLKTASGDLYEIDTRLRPSGASGLLVSSMEAYADYQRTEAWTWEHQALVRARVVAGDPALAQRFEALRLEILGRARDPEQLQREVREMRERMRRELSQSKAEMFDLKQDEGGIADIEFLVQYAVLRWSGQRPALLRWTDNIRLLETLAAEGLMSEVDAQRLADAYRRYRAVVHRRTLQELPALVEAGEFTEWRGHVGRIWREFMETVK
ncbi:MAG: bifunctional [glutamate--ammonia ligase]-adenylyl-L-tyrosine phosphorylase/[glutamate--ammonia-ligase] adenylyltransferase [Gammaproteobacteria bacterium]|nr:bifunctional [glutamate--ammonia ligase]-adenylyl-L-tyrosine phosphorylase/[glutamate--ammonia-ligase] adenylyltransferase [Gammaproteobacteria bacterium]